MWSKLFDDFFNSVIIYTVYYNIVDKGEYFVLLFVPIIYIGFVQIIEAFRKISSDKPEFTLLNEKLLVYDNPNYREIYYSDMVECRIGGNRVDVLIIELNKDKDFPHRKIVKKNKKQTIRLSLRYVKLNSRRLKRILNYKIYKNAK